MQLTDLHKEVIRALKNEPLTSFQILNKVNDTSFTIEVYSIIDELNNMGILNSYMEEDLKYHYVV